MKKMIIMMACAAAISSAPVPQAAQAAGCEEVSFASLDADLTGGTPTRLDAALFRPAGPGPFPAVVALHGASGLAGKGGLYGNYLDWGARLRDAGFVVLFPDSFRPRGLDHGVATLKRDPVPPDRERIRDAYGALRYLQGLPWVRPDRIGLLGWSHGGSTVLAAVDAGLGLRPSAPERNFQVAVAFYPGTWRPLKQPSWRPAVPLSIFVGLKDDWTPAEGCARLAERAHAQGQALELVTYPGAGHGFDAPDVAVHLRAGVNSRTGRATVGTDPAARQDVLARVPAIFRQALEAKPVSYPLASRTMAPSPRAPSTMTSSGCSRR